MEKRISHTRGFLVLLTLLVAWATLGLCAPVLAHVLEDDRRNDGALEETGYIDGGVGSTFDVLRALGDASNAGSGEEEALRQACMLFQDHGSAALQAALTEKLRNPSLLSKFSGNRIGSAIYAQGESAIGGALSSTCASLTGGGSGDMGGFLDADRLKDMAFAYAFDEGLSALKSSGLPFTANVEINGGLFGNGGSSWEVLTVQPLWHDADKQNHIFTQLSWNRTTERAGYAEGDTINAGLAWRRLTDDKTMVYGLNSFFDHALERGHNRMSIGADLQTAEIGVSANKYFPLSDWKSVDAYKEERASSGFDIELQGRLPQFPAWQTNLKGYQWSSNTDMEQETTFGYDASLQWQPVNALVWETGVRDEQDSSAELHTALRLVYRVGDSIEKMWQPPTELPSMEDRVYDKVRRDNAMRVEQRVKDSAYVIVTETTGANSAALADGTTQSLSTGLQLPRPFTITVSAAGGSIARLTFRDGAVLTIGAGSMVRVEATLITLLSGTLQFVSGTQNVALAAPGATVTLLGTDVDLSTNGTTSTLRVRDGRAQIAGTASGATTLNALEAASAVSGVVGASLATNDPAYIAHTDQVSTTIDRVASPQTGAKIAPYPSEAPRLTATTTTPGQPITIGLKFNDIVTVAGATPRLVLDINGNARLATLSGGSGTNDLTFTYTLQPADGGATTATVQSLDLNGATITGNGKNAVTTIADTILNLGGSVSDVTAPSGYAVAFTTDPVSISNHTAASFQITAAEIGATFDYTISSNNGGTNVTGSGTITTATQNVTALDLSGLADGTLTLSLTLTDTATNTGVAATDTVTKTVIALSLDFVNGAYSLNGTAYGSFTAIPGATFSRASPATTYAEDSAGNLVAFAANTPRITDKGILIEGSRTNLAFRSQEFDNVYWSKNLATLTVNSATAPDGTLTAEKIVPNNGVSLNANDPNGAIVRVIGVAASTAWTYSFYAKAGEVSSVRLREGIALGTRAVVSLTDGSIIYEQGSSANMAVTARAVANGWWCIQATRTTGAAETSFGVNIKPGSITGDGTSGIYVWGAQLEQGAFASSYIPTTTAAVTRSAESFTMPSASWVSEAHGTFYALASTNYSNIADAASIRDIMRVDDGTSTNYHRLYHYRDRHGGATAVSAVLQADLPEPSASTTVGTYYKFGYTYAPNKFSFSSSGLLRTDTSGSVPTGLSTMRMGSAGANPLDGYLKELRYYPSAYTDAQLQTLTTP